jgi:methylaspartate mutase sigma subunit
MEKKTLILGVIGADAHAVGNKILNFAFEKAGFNMVNLGVMVSQEEFIEAAVETNAAAILVSSLYGHGEIDCRGLRDKCDEAGLTNIPLYVGGNLVVGKTDFDVVQKTFQNMGFNRVFPPGASVESCIDDIKSDLGVS